MQRLRAIIATSLVLALVFPASALAAISSRIYDLSFVDATKGFMSGVYFSGADQYGFVSSTADGGATWKASSFKNRSMVGVDAYSAASAWGVSSYWNYALKTINTGATWTQSSGGMSALSAPAIPRDVAQLAASAAVVVGQQPNVLDYGELATIWRTTNGGSTWIKEHDWKRYTPRTTDGSIPQTWAEYTAVDASPSGTRVYAVGEERSVDSAGIGFKQAIIARSTNSGADWTDVTPPVSTRLSDVVAVNDSVGWVSAYNRVIRTTNTGASWALTSVAPSLSGINGIDATSDKHAIIVGNSGAVRRTVDGGVTTWKTYTAPSRLDLQSVAILSGTKAIAVGDDGLVVHLTLSADGTMTGTETKTIRGSNAKTPTSLTISAPTTVGYGKTAAISGTLKESVSGKALSGSVKVEVSTDGKSWGSPKTVTVTSGAFSYTTAALTTTRHFRATYAGTATIAAASATKKITPQVYFSAAPYASAYTQTYGNTYSVWGYLKPKHTSGTYPVKFYAYHYEKRSDGTYGYVYKKSFAAKASDYSTTTTRFAASIKLPYAGKWRLRTVHLADSLNAKTYSSYRYITVKRTTLTHYAPSVSAYRSAKLYGYLKYATSTGSLKALSGKTVSVQQYVSGSWKTIDKVTTSSTGRWAYTATPTKKATYRAYYAGTSTVLKQTSIKKVVLPKVYFSSAPRFSTYTHTLGKTYKVWGYLKPKHTSGSTQVKVYAYRYEGGKYVYKKTYSSKISNPSGSSYSKYTGYVKLPSAGKWRIRVMHPEDSSNAKTYSSYRYVTVK